MDEYRQALLECLHGQLTELLLQKQFGPTWGTERGRLFTGGLLNYPLWQLVPLWLQELMDVGLSGGKDVSPSGWPAPPGAVTVEAGGGRKVSIRPEAYYDEEGRPRAEVRELYPRTDGAIWAMLAVLEGGEGIAREGGLERTLREDYQLWRPLRVADEPLNPANERLLECAEAAALYFRPDLDTALENLGALQDVERESLRGSANRRVAYVSRSDEKAVESL